jgi:uncharacterized membrane protein
MMTNKYSVIYIFSLPFSSSASSLWAITGMSLIDGKLGDLKKQLDVALAKQNLCS